MFFSLETGCGEKTMSGNEFFSSMIRCHKTNLNPTYFSHLKSDFVKLTCVNIHFSLGFRPLKTDTRPTHFFHRKFEVVKLTLNQHIFFIWNLSWETDVGSMYFFIRSSTLENQRRSNIFCSSIIQRRKTDVDKTYLFSPNSDIGKSMLGKCIFFHWNFNVVKLTFDKRIFFIWNLSQKTVVGSILKIKYI